VEITYSKDKTSYRATALKDSSTKVYTATVMLRDTFEGGPTTEKGLIRMMKHFISTVEAKS
jgi:hypothetical protein